MFFTDIKYKKIEKKYLDYLKSQEALSEPFRDKIGQLKKFYLPISTQIYSSFLKTKKTKVIGLTGGQGSGKSTISNILKIIFQVGFGLKTTIFSIDDFYKTLSDRKKMSLNVNPLFLTRGVPGTHDTRLLFNCIQKLKSSKFKKFYIPKFDKSIDNRLPKNKWQRIEKKPEIVIFEGWCVGAEPQKKKDLLKSINTLEEHKDKKRIWRTKVNDELKKNYKKIFNLIDTLIFLKVPSFKHVYKWRLLQEKKLKATSTGKKTMNNNQVQNFIMFYERLTKHMLKNFGNKANIIINIDKKHKLKTIKFN
mgnify:CR=1 FL=1